MTTSPRASSTAGSLAVAGGTAAAAAGVADVGDAGGVSGADGARRG